MNANGLEGKFSARAVFADLKAAFWLGADGFGGNVTVGAAEHSESVCVITTIIGNGIKEREGRNRHNQTPTSSRSLPFHAARSLRMARIGNYSRLAGCHTQLRHRYAAQPLVLGGLDPILTTSTRSQSRRGT